MKFPIEVGPPRKIVNNKEEYFNYINACNGKKGAVYRTVYSFKTIKENNRPNYKTAIIDKLFFDFDDKSCNSYKEVMKFHDYLIKENIKHFIVMSGRGYHVYIITSLYKAEYPRATIKNAQKEFIDKLKLTVDPQVIGNPAQMARIPNTFNTRANRYCIPLSKEQFLKGDNYIKDLAKKQNFIKDIFIGDKLFGLNEFDKKSEEEVYINNIEIDDKNIELIDLPHCIECLLKQEDVGWRGRYVLITYFRDKGYTQKETHEILKKHLSPEKFNHCVQDEKQLQYLYSRHDLFFPKCSRLMDDGFCPGKCKKYENVIYKL